MHYSVEEKYSTVFASSKIPSFGYHSEIQWWYAFTETLWSSNSGAQQGECPVHPTRVG
jgi:hypothetical protein